MISKKLLILNGSHSEIPLIESAKSLGYHVTTTGNRPDLPGHRYADDYYYADFSDKETILALARNIEIDNICSCTNDLGALSTAYVAEELNLPGHDSFATTLLIHHKDLFKEYATQHGIPTPAANAFDNKESVYNSSCLPEFPFIVKPVDQTGGKGISTVNNCEELDGALNNAFSFSGVNRIVIEDYFPGTLHSFSTFIVDQRVVFSFSDNEHTYINPYLVSTSSAPSSNINIFRKQLIRVAENFATSLNLVDGILHFQYLANDNDFTIVEITRRCSGDLYPLPVKYSTNVDWASWIIKAECGTDCSDFPSASQSGFCGRHCIMAPENGKLKDIVIHKSLEHNIYQNYSWWTPGDVVENYLVQKFGVLLLKFTSLSEMQEKISNINELVKVELV